MTPRDRIVLGAVAVLVVVAGFYMGVVKPTTTQVADLDAQVASAEQRRDTAMTELATASAARRQYQADQKTLAVLGKAVPSDDGVPSLLYQLHKAARKAGVDFDSVTVGSGAAAAAAAGAAGATGATTDVTPGTTAGPEGLSALPLTVKFDGSFFKLDRFLREVHRFADIGDEKVDVRGRLLTVDAVDLKPKSDSSLLEASLIVNAYVAPAEAQATTTTGTAPGTGATPGSTTGSGTSESTTASTGAAQ